jgi:prepilin-type N-terminal cleavage/methylation domain-containing protein
VPRRCTDIVPRIPSPVARALEAAGRKLGGRGVHFAARENGFTLVECLVTILLMSILIGPVVGALVTMTNAQARQANVVIAQENARTAFARMRRDIHCAHSAGPAVANTSGGSTLVLNETNTSGVAECPGLVALNSASVQWCTVPVTGYTGRYQLFREEDPDTNCNGSVSTFEVDWVSNANPWPTPASCSGGRYPTVTVDLSLDVQEASNQEGFYHLNDAIAERNATPCT